VITVLVFEMIPIATQVQSDPLISRKLSDLLSGQVQRLEDVELLLLVRKPPLVGIVVK